MPEVNIFTAGPARALFFYGQNLIGIGKTLSDTTFNTEITAEEVRGGPGNMLYGQYFHDSNLTVQITDAMFNLQYVAANLGVDVEHGGLSVYESPRDGEAVTVAGQITLANTPVAFDGSVIGWYKRPSDDNWSIATITGTTMSIPSAQIGETYCVKYFYQNENAQSITIKAQYVPRVLHLVLINDLYSGSAANVAASTSTYGRLITDIPQFQLDGAQNLAWAAASAATVSLSGKALAYDQSDTCEEDPVYGTMTQEIFGQVWQDDVIALAVENADLDITTAQGEQLIVRAVYGSAAASNRIDPAALTFAVSPTPASTATGLDVDNTGMVTATGEGEGVVMISLTDYDNVPPAYAHVTVSG